MPEKHKIVQLLKANLKGLRSHIETALQHEYPKNVALKLFDMWSQDFKDSRIVEKETGVYTCVKPLTTSELKEKVGFDRGSIASIVHSARTDLQKLLIPLGEYLISFDITRQRFAFCVSVVKDSLAALRLIWSPHLLLDDDKSPPQLRPTIVACTKRIFFRIGNDVYIRNVTVNDETHWDKCEVLKRLVGSHPASPIRLYVPSGEAAAAFLLVGLFNHQLSLPAQAALIVEHCSDLSVNLVVLGSGIEQPHYDGVEHGLSYRSVHNGIQPSRGERFVDEVNGNKLKVHVLLQRWRRNEKSFVTVVYGSHAAAIEEVVRNLAHEAAASALLTKYPRIRTLLRDEFQAPFECLFVVNLVREGSGFHPGSVEILDSQKWSAKSKVQPAPHSFKKGAGGR